MTPESRKIRLILELRRGGITDTRVLAAMERMPREVFVPQAFADKAYDNAALPIGHQQTVSQPMIVARMTQALEAGKRHKVLEIGTGSGYQAAVLSRVCRRLYTVERHRDLLVAAEKRFQQLRITNITARTGDGIRGWPEQAPFDRIIVTAAAQEGMLQGLVAQLAVGGVMVVPLGADNGEQRLMRVRRLEIGAESEDLGGVRFVPLVAGVAAG